MSELLKTIKADFLAARKAREASTASFLSGLVGTIEQEFAGRATGDATDEKVIAVIKQFLKKNEALLAIENLPQNAIDMVEFETRIIEKYLPVQMTEDKIREVFTELDASNLGLMMKHLKENFAGLYDGALASKVAREFL
jgi:uncharacterized protein YqeY